VEGSGRGSLAEASRGEVEGDVVYVGTVGSPVVVAATNEGVWAEIANFHGARVAW
jgi:hypothetical protein